MKKILEAEDDEAQRYAIEMLMIWYAAKGTKPGDSDKITALLDIITEHAKTSVTNTEGKYTPEELERR